MDPSQSAQTSETYIAPKPFPIKIGLIVLISLVGVAGVIYLFLGKQMMRTPQPSPAPKTENKLTFAPKFTTPTNFDASLQNGPFTCPTIATFCKLVGNYQATSLRGKLSKNTPVYAAFGGEAEIIPSSAPQENGKKEDFILVILTNRDRGLQAMYYFKGISIYEKKEAKEGEAITKASGELLSFMGDQSFIFKLIKAGKEGGLMADLKTSDFK